MEVGDSYDIVELLSTPERDYLIRNNGDRVKIDSLREKIVGILLVVLHKISIHPDFAIDMVEVYNELSPNGDFEVVCVAAVEDEGFEDKDLFDKIFSKMPWFAIPFFDIDSRNRLGKLLPAFCGKYLFILNSNGEVLQTWADGKFREFGAKWYPFTNERIKEIKEEDSAARKEMSLKTLFGNPTRDFVISNKGTKVPICELEGKVVGLYMFEGSSTFMQKLVEIYEKLKDRGENFEIVFVNLHFEDGFEDEKSFEQNFERMPWLALPFMDESCRKLRRIFGYPGIVWYADPGCLVMIGPGGNFVDPYGFTVVENYGIEAYPFTREKAAEIEKERLEAVTLESLFVAANQDFVIRRGGAKIPVSDLVGKSILLFFASQCCCKNLDLLPKLIEWYEEIKRKDDTFEVIYVSADLEQSSFDEFFSKMPWLAFPFEAEHVHSLLENILRCDLPTLVAYGSDGHLLTKRAWLRLENHGADAYPFTNDKLLKEICGELAMRHWWTLIDQNGKECQPVWEIELVKLGF